MQIQPEFPGIDHARCLNHEASKRSPFGLPSTASEAVFPCSWCETDARSKGGAPDDEFGISKHAGRLCVCIAGRTATLRVTLFLYSLPWRR
jgi:hypothetical protein